ncbi:hypothetical protein [Microbacterium sp.]|uniref:hypothetical protein n=1 Tax=Microbacterium sp. TaxID=51671 RepID=UPI003221EC69
MQHVVLNNGAGCRSSASGSSRSVRATEGAALDAIEGGYRSFDTGRPVFGHRDPDHVAQLFTLHP